MRRKRELNNAITAINHLILHRGIRLARSGRLFRPQAQENHGDGRFLRESHFRKNIRRTVDCWTYAELLILSRKRIVRMTNGTFGQGVLLGRRHGDYWSSSSDSFLTVQGRRLLPTTAHLCARTLLHYRFHGTSKMPIHCLFCAPNGFYFMISEILSYIRSSGSEFFVLLLRYSIHIEQISTKYNNLLLPLIILQLIRWVMKQYFILITVFFVWIFWSRKNVII